MHPKMDKDMGDLAEQLGQHRAEVFHRAMRLYIAVKKQQLAQEDLRVFLEDAQGSKTEIVGI